jgi:cell wall-associated NlpC family hydrolase
MWMIAAKLSFVPETRMAAAVVAASLWTSPDAVRDLDQPALESPARVREWAAAQGPAERRELWGRLETQVLLGEQVLVQEVAGGWARVVVPAQPSRKDPRGYPGWLPLSQLDTPASETGTSVVVTVPTTTIHESPDGAITMVDVSFATILPLVRSAAGWTEVNLPGGRTGWLSSADVETVAAQPSLPTAEQLVTAGRQFLGLMYLAGGTHGLSLDCSALTHLIYRRYGVTVPRDAADKVGIGEEVEIDDLQPGDLMFFAKPDTGFVYHCGICTGAPSMLHVSQTDWTCLDAPLTEIRSEHLIVGRRLRAV